jgi:uncharacterized protein YigE (DUF2233 family)
LEAWFAGPLIDGAGARVITTDEYLTAKLTPVLATQSGPMLVHRGRITSSAVMKPQSSSRKIRSGVCAPSPQEVVFVITEAPVTFFEFAEYFKNRVGCRDTLYLDGSISSLYVAKTGLPLERTRGVAPPKAEVSRCIWRAQS